VNAKSLAEDRHSTKAKCIKQWVGIPAIQESMRGNPVRVDIGRRYSKTRHKPVNLTKVISTTNLRV
jgi:hypothetical protein